MEKEKEKKKGKRGMHIYDSHQIGEQVNTLRQCKNNPRL